MKKPDARKVLATFKDMANPIDKNADVKKDRERLRKLLRKK